MESSRYIRGPEYPRSAIDREMNGCGIGLSPGSHRVVELDDHPRIAKPTGGGGGGGGS